MDGSSTSTVGLGDLSMQQNGTINIYRDASGAGWADTKAPTSGTSGPIRSRFRATWYLTQSNLQDVQGHPTAGKVYLNSGGDNSGFTGVIQR